MQIDEESIENLLVNHGVAISKKTHFHASPIGNGLNTF
jgi:hypothetical protein